MDLSTITPLLKTGKPSEIFKKVVAFNTANAEEKNRAMVRIGLGSGFVIEGVPLKMDAEGNVIFTAANNSISYINANSISGVQIMNPEVLMEVLTDGAYFEVPEANVPTSLQLKRAIKSLEDRLKTDYGLTVKSELLNDGITTNAEKYQFQQFLRILQKCLTNIANDPLGKEALAGLNAITISTNEDGLGVIKKEKDHLTTSINFKKKFADSLEKDLQGALESNL